MQKRKKQVCHLVWAASIYATIVWEHFRKIVEVKPLGWVARY